MAWLKLFNAVHITETSKSYSIKKRTAHAGVILSSDNEYRNDEVYRKGGFVDPYIGKDYSGYGYELLSVGIQLAYFNPTALMKDKDYQVFVYGMLALY